MASPTITRRRIGLRSIARVVGAAPAILGQGLISASRETVPIQIKGIDPALEQQVTDIKAAMQSGRVDALTTSSAEALDGILLGKDLATKLGVTLGDSVSLLTPQGTLSPMGMMPRSRRLQVRRHLQPRTVRVRFDLWLRLARRRQAPAREGSGRSDPAARGRHLCRPADCEIDSGAAWQACT